MPRNGPIPITNEHIEAFVSAHVGVWAGENAHNAGLRLTAIDNWLTATYGHGLVEAKHTELLAYRAHALKAGKRDGQPLEPASVVVHIRYLKAFYRWAATYQPLPWDEEVLVRLNPATNLKPPSDTAPKRARKRVATDDEYLALMRTTTKATRRPGRGSKTCNNLRDAAIIALFYDTGVRREELVMIEFGNLDLAERSIYLVHTKRSRSGERKPRTIRFGPHAYAAISAYVRSLPFGRQPTARLFTTSTGRAMKADTITLMLRRRILLAGLDPADFGHWGAHSFRRKVANDWLTDGAPLEELETVMGWKHDGRMASEYAEATRVTRALSAAESFHQRRAGRTIKAAG